MPRLIDGDELYQKVVGYNGGAVDKTVAKRLIDQMPTIDAVSRQAAIDLVTDMEFMNNTAKGILRDRLRKLPSAQPEIIRCKDCKYWHKEIHNGIEYFNFSSCDLNHGGDGNNFYCADAERRTDG